jgi:uncharacterized protein YoaH (UPF0181 family)
MQQPFVHAYQKLVSLVREGQASGEALRIFTQDKYKQHMRESRRNNNYEKIDLRKALPLEE